MKKLLAFIIMAVPVFQLAAQTTLTPLTDAIKVDSVKSIGKTDSSVSTVIMENATAPVVNAKYNDDAPTKKVAPWFVNRFRFSAGFMYADNNTEISLGNSSGSIGTSVDFEKDLGFDKRVNTFLGNFQWRINRRWRFDFSYYQLNRNASKQIQKTINFGDSTYNFNANVNSYFNNNIYRVSWGYAILSKPKYEVGLLLGFHTMQTDLGIGINSTAGNVNKNESITFTAPLPDLGIWGGFAIGKRIAFNGEISYLSISAGEFKGSILSYNATAMLRLTKHIDFSLGYSGFDFTLDATFDKQITHIGWGYKGPSIALAYSILSKKWTR